MRAFSLIPGRYFLLFTILSVFTLIGCIADENGRINDVTPNTTQGDELRPEHIPIIMTSVISFFAFVISLTIIWYKFISKRNEQRHEEIMALIEKGEYDPALFEARGKYRKEMFFFSAIILIALGIALTIGVPIASKRMDGIIAGLIPFFMGLGLLVFFYLLGRMEKSRGKSKQ